MKFMLGIFTSLFLFCSSVQAEVFFQKNVKEWSIVGEKAVSNLNDSCYIRRGWQQLSSFMLVQDMKDGELYLILRNSNWSIIDPPGSKNVLSTIFNRTSGQAKWNADYMVMATDTIMIRGINTEVFLTGFAESQSITLQMPGSIISMAIDLDGSRQVFETLIECMKSYVSTTSKPPGTDL